MTNKQLKLLKKKYLKEGYKMGLKVLLNENKVIGDIDEIFLKQCIKTWKRKTSFFTQSGKNAIKMLIQYFSDIVELYQNGVYMSNGEIVNDNSIYDSNVLEELYNTLIFEVIYDIITERRYSKDPDFEFSDEELTRIENNLDNFKEYISSISDPKQVILELFNIITNTLSSKRY